MKYRALPESGQKVSEISLDLGLFCRKELQIREDDARRWIQRAFDAGVTLFDASEKEGEGYAEELLAKALPKQRDEWLISTKIGYDIYSEPSFLRPIKKARQDFSPANLRLSVDKALQRMRTDRLDILQLHHPGAREVEADEVWDTLDALKRAGKILVSGAAFRQREPGLRAKLECLIHRKPQVVQHDLNLLQPYPGRVLAAAAATDSSRPETLHGYEYGKAKETPQSASRIFARNPTGCPLMDGALTAPLYGEDDVPEASNDEKTQAIRRVRELNFLTGPQTGRTLAQAALLWVLADPAVASCMVRASTLDGWRELASASEKNPLTAAELDRVRELQDSWMPPQERELAELE